MKTVASFTDAWIETNERIIADEEAVVASFTDAWIETLHLLKRLWKRKSHLLQMRGLKLFVLSPSLDFGLVASFTDAWIETSSSELGTS